MIPAQDNPYHGIPYVLDHPIATHVATQVREIALTFDDGPHPEATGSILEILKRRGVHATFFAVGHNVRRAPDLARRIVAEGHTLGNHTDTHPCLTRLPEERIEAEIVACQETIERVTGTRPTLFRPAYGQYDASVLAISEREGLRPIQWSAMVWDWLAPSPDEAVRFLEAQIAPGAIVLLHDGSNVRLDSRESTIRMLPRLLDLAQWLGYRWCRLNDRLGQLG